MTLGGVVRCAAGLLVAQRGHALPPGADGLCVTDGTVVLPDTAPLEAQSGDGRVWRRLWSRGDTLLLDFVDVGTVAVDIPTGRVCFDPVLPAEVEQHLLLDHVLPLVLARRGALVLHGGVICRGGEGIVLVGASGAGKSTLTAYAGQRGWSVGGDDGAVLSLADPVTAEATYATVRLTPASADLLGIDVAGTSPVVGKRRLRAPSRQDPVPLRAIARIEPVAAGQPASFERLSGVAAHLQLFVQTFHADFAMDQRLPHVFDELASVVERTVVGRLRVPRGIEGLVAAEELLRAVVAPVAAR